MNITIWESKQELGQGAADLAAGMLREQLDRRGEANLILATGASQFEMLAELVRADLDWARVTVFHLDEYLGLPATHPASFRKYLRERFVDQVRTLKQFHFIDGQADPRVECRRLAELIGAVEIDVACVGIGENGHLAFNDPPADFQTREPYLVVELDEACRKQQLGEGWFPTLDAVPRRAISMSIRQILKSRAIVCTVPDARKAQAVHDCFARGLVSPDHPASILRTHPNCFLQLDRPAASLLPDDRRAAAGEPSGEAP
jgi:glucosamine-6-phosphate deaminase